MRLVIGVVVVLWALVLLYGGWVSLRDVLEAVQRRRHRDTDPDRQDWESK